MTTITIPNFSLRSLAQLIQREPAVSLYAANAVTAAAVLWGFHLSADETGAISLITTAAATLIIAALARPPAVPIMKGAALAILTSLQAFHYHAPPEVTSGTVAVLSILMGLMYRPNLTPVIPSPAPALSAKMMEAINTQPPEGKL